MRPWMHKESESGRRVSGRQAEAESRSRHREQLEFLFGWNFLDVSEWPEQQLERLARATLCRTLASKIGRLGSGQHTGISHGVFLPTPLPLVFCMERFHDQVSSGNATRSVTSLRLTTHESTLKVLKIPAGKNLFDCIYPSNPHSLTKGPLFTEPLHHPL